MAPQLLTLHATYSYTDIDEYGTRAVVPRAVPLSPPFEPKVTEYKIKVPSWADSIEVETAANQGFQVQVGNTSLKRGWNTIRVLVHSQTSGQSKEYTLKVKRERERRLLRRVMVIGSAVSALALGGLLFILQGLEEPPPPPPPNPLERLGSFINDFRLNVQNNVHSTMQNIQHMHHKRNSK